MKTLRQLREFSQIILAKKSKSVPEVIMHSSVPGSAKGSHYTLARIPNEPIGERAKFPTSAKAVSHFLSYGHGNVV